MADAIPYPGPMQANAPCQICLAGRFFCSSLCGADRDRTDDLMTASHALSQLSYSPIGVGMAETRHGSYRPKASEVNQKPARGTRETRGRISLPESPVLRVSYRSRGRRVRLSPHGLQGFDRLSSGGTRAR